MVKNVGLELNNDGLPSLARFKKVGSRMALSMEQPVLLSINLCNLKFFNEIYGPAVGDDLINYMVHYFCFDNESCELGTRSYVDHLLILCEGNGESRLELSDRYEEFLNQFLDNVNRKYPRARIHLDCGMYIIQPGDDFLSAQDNARYARRSIHNSYSNTIAFYEKTLREESLAKASVIPNFERAIENGDIMVLLQPKCSASTNEIIGAEALSRFRDEEGNIISPDLYVPILENASVVSQLDFEVLCQVVDLQRRWMNEGRKMIPVSVNLSRMDFLEPGFIEMVDDFITAANVPKEMIEFELTETAVVENLNEIIEKLNFLQDAGYRIAMDDFGSGYNSLYVLGKIPANVIKFDRGFVLHSIQNQVGMTILANLVDTFKEINFEVLCEGVETEEEKEKIVSCGCDIIQGYLYDKPLEIEEFEKKYM